MKENESKALQQVWEWKERAFKEVEHLATDQALKKRLEDSLQTVHQLGLTVNNKNSTFLSRMGNNNSIVSAKTRAA